MSCLLSLLFSYVSCVPIISFVKMTFLGYLEGLYNIYRNLLKKKQEIVYKKLKKPQLALVTGGTKGIGRNIVDKLINLGYHVFVFSRDVQEMQRMQDTYGCDKLRFAYLDLANPKSIVKIAKDSFKDHKIHLVINNAGIFYQKIAYKNNIEYNFLVNYFGHFLLVEALKKNIIGRIVNLSSSAMFSTNNIKTARFIDFFMDNYAKSKLANTLHALNLKSDGYECVSVHPGIIATSLFNNTLYGQFVKALNTYLPFIFTSLEDATNNVLYAAFTKNIDPNIRSVDFFMNGNKAYVPSYVDFKNATYLRLLTEKLCSNLEISFDE